MSDILGYNTYPYINSVGQKLSAIDSDGIVEVPSSKYAAGEFYLSTNISSFSNWSAVYYYESNPNAFVDVYDQRYFLRYNPQNSTYYEDPIAKNYIHARCFTTFTGNFGDILIGSDDSGHNPVIGFDSLYVRNYQNLETLINIDIINSYDYASIKALGGVKIPSYIELYNCNTSGAYPQNTIPLLIVTSSSSYNPTDYLQKAPEFSPKFQPMFFYPVKGYFSGELPESYVDNMKKANCVSFRDLPYITKIPDYSGTNLKYLQSAFMNDYNLSYLPAINCVNVSNAKNLLRRITCSGPKIASSRAEYDTLTAWYKNPVGTFKWRDTWTTYNYYNSATRSELTPIYESNLALFEFKLKESKLYNLGYYLNQSVTSGALIASGLFSSLTEISSYPEMGPYYSDLRLAFCNNWSLIKPPMDELIAWYNGTLDYSSAFLNCCSLTAIPKITLSSTNCKINANYMFFNCPNVESGLSAFYSNISATCTLNSYTFKNCGTNTTQGMAERALIPTAYGGDKQ